MTKLSLVTIVKNTSPSDPCAMAAIFLGTSIQIIQVGDQFSPVSILSPGNTRSLASPSVPNGLVYYYSRPRIR